MCLKKTSFTLIGSIRGFPIMGNTGKSIAFMQVPVYDFIKKIEKIIYPTGSYCNPEFMSINARRPKINSKGQFSNKSSVYLGIKESLFDTPQNFFTNHSGITLNIASRSDPEVLAGSHNTLSKVTIEFSDTKVHGIVNGGHSTLYLIDLIRDAEKEAEKGQGLLLQAVKKAYILVILRAGLEDIYDSADSSQALNTNLSVDTWSFMNQMGLFDRIKDSIKNTSYASHIMYFNGDLGGDNHSLDEETFENQKDSSLMKVSDILRFILMTTPYILDEDGIGYAHVLINSIKTVHPLYSDIYYKLYGSSKKQKMDKIENNKGIKAMFGENDEHFDTIKLSFENTISKLPEILSAFEDMKIRMTSLPQYPAYYKRIISKEENSNLSGKGRAKEKEVGNITTTTQFKATPITYDGFCPPGFWAPLLATFSLNTNGMSYKDFVDLIFKSKAPATLLKEFKEEGGDIRKIVRNKWLYNSCKDLVREML